MSRAVFIRPKQDDRKHLMVGLDDYLRLKKPLYGICDSGDYWGATLTEHIREYLQMEPLTGSLAVRGEEKRAYNRYVRKLR